MSNKYTYSMPYSEQELFDLYVTKNMSQTEIGNMFGVSQHKVWHDLRRIGVPSRVAAPRDQYGENNSSWKGGKLLVNHKTKEGHRYMSNRNENKGYYMVLCKGHKNASKMGYVFEHVKIALETAGRDFLDSNIECVHHINFVRTDNRPENLVICTKDKHREYHGKLENLTGELLDKGIVGFDSELGYFIK
jgi:hypothetical protein